MNSIHSDLWSSAACRLHGLTVFQTCVYQMMFKNVYEFTKRLMKSDFVWSRTLSTLLSMKKEIISVPVFTQWADISNNCAVNSWKTEQLH